MNWTLFVFDAVESVTGDSSNQWEFKVTFFEPVGPLPLLDSDSRNYMILVICSLIRRGLHWWYPFWFEVTSCDWNMFQELLLYATGSTYICILSYLLQTADSINECWRHCWWLGRCHQVGYFVYPCRISGRRTRLSPWRQIMDHSFTRRRSWVIFSRNDIW